VLFAGIPEIFGFGYYPGRADVQWVAAAFFQKFIAFSAVPARSLSYGYVLDCYRGQSIEVSVASFLLGISSGLVRVTFCHSGWGRRRLGRFLILWGLGSL
jgi:hypothetical protein